MNAKTLFQKDKTLSDMWAAVCYADWFERVLVYAVSDLTEGALSQEELSGVKKLKHTLLTMCDEETTTVEEPSSGFQHDVLGAVKKLKAK